MKFPDTQITLALVDLETSEIVASVTGTGKSTDVGAGDYFLAALPGLAAVRARLPTSIPIKHGSSLAKCFRHLCALQLLAHRHLGALIHTGYLKQFLPDQCQLS
ncbi:MAG: hypothetical protein HZC43_05705 [Nitrosomonadales bacterium]|nr:hypothetical protein [Nitrosomonadales bacterium]